FFQAEDGIRDSSVTGVQTCALPISTNTSYLDVNAIAAVTVRPQDVLGLHFFSPANVMRLVEVVRAEKTAPDVLATALDLGKRLRSEERRVGKEGSYRREADHYTGNE